MDARRQLQDAKGQRANVSGWAGIGWCFRFGLYDGCASRDTSVVWPFLSNKSDKEIESK